MGMGMVAWLRVWLWLRLCISLRDEIHFLSLVYLLLVSVGGERNLGTSVDIGIPMSRRAGFTQDQRALLSLTVIFTVRAVVAVTTAARTHGLNGDFHRWGGCGGNGGGAQGDLNGDLHRRSA